jgi:transmembrane 9 superfamily protein 3
MRQVNKVGPYENPQETYSYYTLPFCKRDAEAKVKTRWAGFGEALEGNSLIESDYGITFAQDSAKTTVCSMVLDAQAADMFRYAVANHYWANLVLDELPIWAMLGETRDVPEPVGKPLPELKVASNGTSATDNFLYTHKRFSIAYNGNRLIEVNMTHENPVRIGVNVKMDLSYEVAWHNTSKPFSHRFRRYLDKDFFEHQIHWFSIINSFMMVIFLVGLVGLILMRTLKSDLHRYARHMDEEDGLGDAHDDTGWKQVRPPPSLSHPNPDTLPPTHPNPNPHFLHRMEAVGVLSVA